jgi:pyruvate kinase
MRRTKIICTIGPASQSAETIREMIRAGMNVARLNFSHGTYAEHRTRINTLRSVAAQLGHPLGILLDTKGPEIRIGSFSGGAIQLQEDNIFTLTTSPVEGDGRRVYVNYPELHKEIKPGATVLLDDGLLQLEVVTVVGDEIKCRVVHGGTLRNGKKVNLPDTRVSLPAFSEQDQQDLIFGIRQGIDYIAASFIRNAAGVLAIKRFLEEEGAAIPVIAKIENLEGVENIDSILKVADGLMVARGDLGVEIPAEDVPILQKQIIKKCNQAGKLVITATQMLESMVEKSRPTRAEASDVANAIFDGSDAIMLSAETATGKYPVEAVKHMNNIAQRAETALDYAEILRRKGAVAQTITDAVGYATCTVAHNLHAAAILTATQSGYTSRVIAKYRPKAPIIAVTPQEKVLRQLTMVWGVHPVLKEQASSTDEMFASAITAGLDQGLIKNGDLVVITAGHPVGVPGTTNLIKVHTVGDILLRGIGIGQGAATGRVCLAGTHKELQERFQPGDVIVALATDREYMPFVEQAAAVVTEEAGLTSHAAVVGLSLGIPVVVGAKGALKLLAAEVNVTVDSGRGLIYRGRAHVY